MGLVSLLTDASSEMVYPVLPLFLANVLGAPVAAIGLIESLAEAAASFMKVGSGWLSDRVGRRKPLIALGYTMVYGIIGMINFAHGDVFMVSTFIALILFLLISAVFGTIGLALALLLVLIGAMALTALWEKMSGVAYRLGNGQTGRLDGRAYADFEADQSRRQTVPYCRSISIRLRKNQSGHDSADD